MPKALIACISVAASPVFAQHAIPVAPAGRAVPGRAIRVAAIHGSLVPSSDWISITRPRDVTDTVAAFDAFGGDPTGAPTGFCEQGCLQNAWCPGSPPGTRWWSGPNFRSPLSTNDFRPDPDLAGRPAVRAQFAWWWAHPEPTSCFVAVLTGDDFTACSTSTPPVSGNRGGIVFDFGALDEHGGYWWADIDLRGTGLSWALPADGSYTIMLGTAYDPWTGAFAFDTAPGTQPMQWGVGAPPGSSGPMQWDDWRNANGALEWNECSYYDDVVRCPRPQGIMAAFWVERSCYVNCDGSQAAPVLSANDFLCFVNAYAALSAYANCDGSSGIPAHTPNDFACFLTRYAAGCS